jgi:hypothetical protein
VRTAAQTFGLLVVFKQYDDLFLVPEKYHSPRALYS